MDWMHSGAVMNYTRYVKPRDGTMYSERKSLL
jgi:hypothetical protein